MNGEAEIWIARAVVAAIVTACVGLFVRMRKAENRAGEIAKDVEHLQKRSPPDYSEQLRQIDDRLRTLEARVGSGRSGTEIWTEVKGLARSLSHTDKAVGEIQGALKELRSLTHAIDHHLRGGKGGE